MAATALNATSAALLGLLQDAGPLTGAELVRTAQTRIGNYWNVTRSQVYRELARLQASKCVAAGARGARDAQPFRITRTGTTAFRAWLADTEPSETIRLGLLVFVAFGRHLPPDRLADLLAEHEAHHRHQLDRYRELDAEMRRAGTDPYVRATLSFGLHYEEAVLRWFDDLPPEVRSGSA